LSLILSLLTVSPLVSNRGDVSYTIIPPPPLVSKFETSCGSLIGDDGKLSSLPKFGWLEFIEEKRVLDSKGNIKISRNMGVWFKNKSKENEFNSLSEVKRNSFIRAFSHITLLDYSEAGFALGVYKSQNLNPEVTNSYFILIEHKGLHLLSVLRTKAKGKKFRSDTLKCSLYDLSSPSPKPIETSILKNWVGKNPTTQAEQNGITSIKWDAQPPVNGKTVNLTDGDIVYEFFSKNNEQGEVEARFNSLSTSISLGSHDNRKRK